MLDENEESDLPICPSLMKPPIGLGLLGLGIFDLIFSIVGKLLFSEAKLRFYFIYNFI